MSQSSPLLAQEAKVTELMSEDLTNLPGKEGLMITVEYPPGSVDPIHRHNAQGFIYVLEGSIVMQVRGGKEVTVTPGQTFYEGPDGLGLVLGVLTPASCIGSLAFQGVIVYQVGTAGLVHCSLSILLATAVLMLGPGAYSVDARLFGRRQVVVRKTTPERKPPN